MALPLSVIPPRPREHDPVEAVRESAETLALLARRRSTKIAHLIEPGPSDAEIEALLTLAARVPDHGKLGPWRFVIIAGDARARAGVALERAIAGDDGVDETRSAATRGLFLRAPVCVMVISTAAPHPKIPEWEQVLSCGAAAFALLVGAHALGYAGCLLSEWPVYDERARAALGLAERERIAGFVYLGSTREPALERVRANVTTRISRF